MNSLDDLDLQTEMNRSKYSKSTLPRFASVPQFQLDPKWDSLSLQQQKLISLPMSLHTLTRLKILNLNDNFIKQLDWSVMFELPHLEVFTIRNNLLQEFQFIDNWKLSLKTLDISQNHIKIIKPEIGQFLNLEHLYIAHNSFIEIPKSLTKLKYTLSIFQLDWFKYSDPPSFELFQTQEIIFSLFSTIDSIPGEYVSAKVLLSSIQYKQFTLKFQTKLNLQFKLHQAILDEDIGMLRTLLSEAKKNQPDQLNNDGYSPLGLSILEEKYLASRYLIYANADPNKGGSWFAGCINLAVSKLQYYLVIDLIKRGAKITQVDIYGNNAIHYLFSVYSFNEIEAQKILELLLQQGINQNQMNQIGFTAIHLAVQKGYLSLLEYVYEFSRLQKEYNFNFNKKTGKEKNTCLHLAVITRQINLVKFVVMRYPEQLFSRNKYDMTPIDYLKNDLTIYKYLKGLQMHCSGRRIKLNVLNNPEPDDPNELISIRIKSKVKIEIFSNSNSPNKYKAPDSEILCQCRSQTRINEIARSIPLSPNNLKRVEEKNSIINMKDTKLHQIQIFKQIKKIGYEFERIQHNSLNDLLNQYTFSEQLADYILVKKLFFYLNIIKNIIDTDKTYQQQWQFQLKHFKNIPIQSSTSLDTHSRTTNGLFKIFNLLTKKVEKQITDSLNFQERNYIINYFFNVHCGFGLSKLVICQNELLKECTCLLNQMEMWQTQQQLLKLHMKYNILNNKVLNYIFTS